MLTSSQFSGWLSALRSGNYKQTESVLRKDDCFCALGVLCDTLTKDPSTGFYWLSPSPTLSYNRYRIAKDYFESVSTIPKSLLSSELSEEIVHLNDEEKKDFNYIADYLEERRSYIVG